MAVKGRKFLFALSILIGTLVGAGIFGIPYVISKSGIIPGLFYLVFLGAALLLIHLFYGEIILRTKGRHHLPSLAEKYLGRKGKILATISAMVGLSGALLAYVIIGGDFLKIVFSSFLDLPSFYFSLFFLAFLSYFIFRGMKLIAPTELITNLLFFAIVFAVLLLAFPKVDLENFSLINLENTFLPYGVILFSLVGFTAIPGVGAILKTDKERKGFKKVLVLGFFITVVLYILFSLTVVGVSGRGTSPETLQGLIPFLGPQIVFFGALAAAITLADSFLAIGLYLRNTLIYDYKFSKITASIFTCFVPLILFLLGFRSFIGTIGFVGLIVGTVEGIIIIAIFRKAKTMGDREPEYTMNLPFFLTCLLILVLILGAASQLL